MGTVAAFEYRFDTLPSDEVLAADLMFLVSVLGELYEAESRALDIPGEPAPEVADAITLAEKSAGRRRAGQGTRLSPRTRWS